MEDEEGDYLKEGGGDLYYYGEYEDGDYGY